MAYQFESFPISKFYQNFIIIIKIVLKESDENCHDVP